MRAADFDLSRELRFEPDSGQILLADERMLLFRQHAFSCLRKVLWEQLEPDVARSVLFQFGYLCGMGDFHSLRTKYSWDSEDDELMIGPMMHAWEGIVLVEPELKEYDRKSGHFHFTGRWHNSYEAQTHIDQIGISDTPVCFSLTGYGSGWCTEFFGQDVLEIETKCVAKGDPCCAWEIRRIDDWGDEAAAWKTARTDSRRSIIRELRRSRAIAERSVKYFQEQVQALQPHGQIIGNSPALGDVLSTIEKISTKDVSVLITGERGSGKELVAREIHRRSLRAQQPFVAVNCAAIQEGLFESEFFGHAAGSFTGATDRDGRFEVAEGGTLFLDEVGEIPVHVQPKLLRVLENHEFERVGESHVRTADVRVLAASNRDLTDPHVFRQELRDRLGRIEIHVPPLRERCEDIPSLVEYNVNRFCQKHNEPDLEILPETIDRLKRYSWPGNIRELENVLESAVLKSSQGVLMLDRHFGRALMDDEDGRSLRTMAEVEREHILHVLSETTRPNGKWNVGGSGGAASVLGMPPSNLRRRMKKLGILRPADK